VTEPYLEIALRLGAAWLAGCLIGLERTLHGRPAGFRTFGLITLSSAMLMAFTFYQGDLLPSLPADSLRIDPQRIATGIMTGIGFIGAGVIFKEGLTVHGLTSAASVWAAAALGVIIGAGFWWPSILALAIIFFTLTVLKRVEERLPRRRITFVRLCYAREGAPSADAVRSFLDAGGMSVKDLSYRLDPDKQLMEYHLVVHSRDRHSIDRLAQRFCGMGELRGFEFSPSDE
jgi:putative Mg2+ transporter-C (MgtC) family protein